MRRNKRDNRDRVASGGSGSSRLPADEEFGIRKDRDFLKNPYLNICRFYMLLIGLWPYDKAISIFLKRAVCLLTAGSFIMLQLCKFYTTEVTFDLVIDIMSPLLFSIIALIKYMTCWVHHGHITVILEKLKAEWDSITDAAEMKILESAAREGKFYILCEGTMSCGGTLLFLSLQYIPYTLDFVLPLNESRPNYHPFVAEYFVDSNEYFLPILLHMQVCIILSMTLIVGTDSTITTYFLHTCGMINIIGHRLKHLFDSISSTDDTEFRIAIWIRVARTVRLHRDCKRRVNQAVNTFALSYIVQMILIVITITGLLLQLHKALATMDDTGFLVLTVCRVIGHFIVVFLNIVPAQRLVDCSGALFHDVYCGQWYNAPVESQKFLLIVMAGTFEPMRVAAGNLVHMSFETFASMVQMTFSYFTVFSSIDD